MKNHDPTLIIDVAATRAGFRKRREEMCRLANIPLSTFNRQRKKGDYPLSEIQRLHRVIHFTDEECKQLVGGMK